MEQMHNDTRPDQANATTMTVDPVIGWLEQCRDFMGSTPQAKDMAQRAIDRLRPPAVDPWTIVGALVDDLGTLRAAPGGALTSDRPNHPAASADDAGYYGGYLVCETITRRNAIAFTFLPQLLVAARENRQGRAILAQLAAALQAPAPVRERVRDRLEGTHRLAQLASEFKFAGEHIDESDPFYVVSQMLERIAQGLLDGTVQTAAADVEAWLTAKREARHAARTGASA